jgi:hypothetical protein
MKVRSSGAADHRLVGLEVERERAVDDDVVLLAAPGSPQQVVRRASISSVTSGATQKSSKRSSLEVKIGQLARDR